MKIVLGIMGDWITSVQNGWDVTGLAALFVAVLSFVSFGARLAWIDARTHLLPNKLVLPWMRWTFVLLVVAGLAHGEPQRAIGAVAGGVVLFAGYLVLHLVQRSGMGMGDVKLAAILGAYLGFVSWWHVLWGTLFAFLLGSLFTLGGIVVGKMRGSTSIAFGPFMLLGAVIALAIGS
ncbi:prepilin peptidase [Neomicrococcus lactis]